MAMIRHRRTSRPSPASLAAGVLAAAVPAQNPPPRPAPQREPLIGMRYVPRSARVTLGVRDIVRNWDSIKKTGIGQLVDKGLWQKLAGDRLQSLMSGGRQDM